MPTVLRVDGFQVRIYSDDHRPAHVHVVKAGAVVVITLDPVAIRDVRSMRDADIASAVAIVETHVAGLLTKWREIHG